MPPSVTLEYKDYTGTAPAVERKSAPTAVTTEGVVEAYVAVTGIRDDVGDIIEPGAFTESLTRIQPKMCLGHDWNRPIGLPEEVIEMMPGDPRLPKTTHSGAPWPAEAGALWTRSRYMLDTEDGRNAYAAALFYGPKTAYSIGYVPDKTKVRFVKHGGQQTRVLPKLDLYEFGPVLHGANDLARQGAVKSLPARIEGKIRLVRSMEYWGLPVGTPIRPGMKPRGPVARKREREGKPVDENLGAVEIDQNNPHSTRVKPTAKGKNKRDDGTFESDILELFVDGNTDPDSEDFVTSDPSNLPDRQRINKGDAYNPLDMLIANGVLPVDLEDDLRGAEWTRGRRAGEVEDANASPEVQAFIDNVMDVYREKYNAALVQQNSAGQRDDIAEDEDNNNVDVGADAEPAKPRRSTTSLMTMGPAEASAAVREMDDAELEAHDTELTARAASLGKPGQRNRAHEAVAAERERRKSEPPEQAAPADAETPPVDEPVTVVEADPAPGFAIPPPPADEETTPPATDSPPAPAGRSGIYNGNSVTIVGVEGDQATVYDGNTQQRSTVPLAEVLTGGASPDKPVTLKLTNTQRDPASNAFADADDEFGATLSADGGSLVVTDVADAVRDVDMALELAEENPDRRAERRPLRALRAKLVALAKPGETPQPGTPDGTETAPDIENPDVPAGDVPSPVDGEGDVGADIPPGDIPEPVEGDAPALDSPEAVVEGEQEVGEFEPGAVLGDDGKPVANVPVNDAGDYYDPNGDIVSGHTQFDEALNAATDAINDGDPAALATALQAFTRWVEPPDGKFRFDARGEAEEMIDLPTQEAIAKVQAWADEANAKQGTEEETDRADTVDVLKGVDDDYLAGEAARLRGVLIERSAAGTPATDGLTREAAMRLRAILAEQSSRTEAQDTGEAPTLPTPDDVATITAEEIADGNAIADASHGIHEADDGEFEAEPDIADRQDRVAGLLGDEPPDFTDYSDDALRSTRADVVAEMRLQDYLTARRGQERAVAKREQENAASTSGEITEPEPEPERTGPKPRPGVAGAAEDLADAMDDGDEDRVRTTRARLEASLRRSRSDSEYVATLRGMLESGEDVTPEQLRATAEAIRIEARDRRNEQARDRRRVRRFERDRLRSLLSDVESTMSGRGLAFDAVPEANEDLNSPALGKPGAGSWSTRQSRVDWLNRNDTIGEVSGEQYTASVISPASGKSIYEWSVTAPGGAVFTGRGEVDSADDAIRVVESVLATHRSLGNLPVDAVLPQSLPARETSAQTLGEFVAGVDGIRDRLTGSNTSLNPLTGERDPIRAASALRPPTNPVFTSPDQVRQHLLAKLAAETDERLKRSLEEATGKIRWDDVQLTKGGGLAVQTIAGKPGVNIMHTVSGRLILMPGALGKADSLRAAAIMEGLPDRHGRVVPFDQDADELRAAMNAWEADSGSTGIIAFRDRVKAELAASKLRAGNFTSPLVRDFVDGKFDWGNRTNTDRKSFVDMQIRSVGYLLTDSNTDKATKNVLTGARAYLKAGSPDLAIALLRRRAGELREEFGAQAADRGAIALDDAATGLLSMWSPQASPGTRARRMKAGERITFAENDGVRTFRAINDMRAESVHGGQSSTLAIDESNGTVYRLLVGRISMGDESVAISPQYGGGYPIVQTELGGDKFVISGDGEDAPTEADQVRPRNLADAASVPPEVVDVAATFLPETQAEVADRRAAAPAGGRAPRRGTAGAPARRVIAQPSEVPPVPGEQHLAMAQSRLRTAWLGVDNVELADKADTGGFTSVEQWREWAADELARIRRDEPNRERNFAVIEGPDYETLKLSPGGHFLVTKSGYVVHARTTGAVWGAGDGFRRITSQIGEVTVETSALMADYLERVTVDGDRMNWQAPDIATEIGRFREAHDKTAVIIPAARLAYQHFAAYSKKPLRKKELDTLGGLTNASLGLSKPTFAPPNDEAVRSLNLPGMASTYGHAGGVRAQGAATEVRFAGSKAGTTLARRVQYEIETANSLYPVAPLDAVRRLNRVADEIGDDTAIETVTKSGPGESFHPAADLRRIAKGITDAFDETKISPAGLMRRNNDTGQITAGPKSEITAYMAASRPFDKTEAAEFSQQLKASPEIRVWRDADGHLHASFLDFTVGEKPDYGSGEDAAVLGTGPDGRFSVTWTDRRTSARLKLELPPGSWEFEPETVADPAGNGEGNLTEPDAAGQDRTEPDGATSDNAEPDETPVTPPSGAQGAVNRDAAQVAREKDSLKDLDVDQLKERLADAERRAGTDASVQEEVRVLRREIDARESAAQDVPKAPK